MNVVPFPRSARSLPESQARVSEWLGRHRTSLCVMLPVLVLVALSVIINFDGFPGRVNDDEGTYAVQAWAVLYRGQLSHYTYWYDHPPLGWLQIAGYAWLTDGFHRAATAVTVGREFMVLMHLISCGLLYILARRLNFSRVAGVVAVLLFTYSPIAFYYHRMVFLDNIAVMWTLAALVFAASPRRSLAAVFGSGLSFAFAVLSKETALVMLPVVLWVVLQHQSKDGRGWSLGVFLPAFFGPALFYPLYAVLKNELLQGSGHVSLVWAIEWQLFKRQGSGSVLDPSSVSYQTVHWWLQTDPWLLIAGTAAVVPAIFIRRLRPLAFGMGLQVVMLLRSGYLPQPYVIALMPLAALLLAGTGEVLFKARPFGSIQVQQNKFGTQLIRGLQWSVARTGIALVLATSIAFGVMGGSMWVRQVHYSDTYNPSAYSREAVEWVHANVAKTDVVITDDNIWGDLVMAGYTKPVWLYKADLDPAVKAQLLPHGWRDVKYLVLPDLSESLLKSLPIVWAAIQHSHVVEIYGTGDAKMIVRVVGGK